ncbi:MAG: PorP/SprF family type IX secretion system membrane protein [Bacteroidota bacterium]
MKKIILILLVFLTPLLWRGAGGEVFAQQDPQYSQYMFNQLAINPAYAGSKEALSTALFLRSQWTGIDGAPTTNTITAHGPLRKRKVGLGLAIISDKIGPKKSTGILGSYAYRIPIKNGKLAFGLRAGVYSYTYNWAKIEYKDPADVYNSQNQTSVMVPTADAGLYYYTNTIYLGISATHITQGRITKVANANGDNAQLSPHYFFTMGKAWDLSDKLIFNLSCMIKAAKNAPSTGDLNFSFLLNQRLWVGFSFRSQYGIVAYTQFHINEKFKLGYAYDFGLNRIGRAGGGSHEIMLSYDFNIFKSKIVSPRYL